MSTIYPLPAGHSLTVTADDGQTAHAQQVEDATIAAFVTAAQVFGPYLVDRQFVVTGKGSAAVSAQPVDPSDLDLDGGSVGITDDYADTGHSHQTIWADLNLDPAAGSDDGTDPKFLAAVMGNILGDQIAGEGNYLAGVIGAYSASGAGGSDYPKAALMGVVMDGSTDADAAVLAVIDGSDPSSETRARAAFGVAVNSNEADSGVDYGVDLFATPNPHFTDTPGDGQQGLNVAKAEVRMSSEVCIITMPGAPVDYTDGSPPATGEGYAEKGSLCVRIDTGKLYINGGTKAQPLWKLVTSA